MTARSSCNQLGNLLFLRPPRVDVRRSKGNARIAQQQKAQMFSILGLAEPSFSRISKSQKRSLIKNRPGMS